MIRELVLLWAVLLQTLSIPFCQSERQLDKVVLTTTERVEVEFSLYIQGFNLTYQLSEDNQTSVRLVDPLTSISTSRLPCSGDIKLAFLVAGIETNDDGKWQGQFMVIIGNQTDICLSLGSISQSQEITFTVEQQFTDLDVSSCLSACKVSDSWWLVHCQKATSQVFYLYGIGQIGTYELPPTDPIVKSQIYNESGSILIITLTTTSVNIYSWDPEEGIVELNRLNASSFNKSSLNLTDFVYTQKLVVSDYAEGCFRMDLDNGVVSNFENIHLGESVAIRIAGVGSEYLILSEHEILQIVWLETHSIINIYQIEDGMSDIISMSANQELIILQSETFDYVYRRGVTSLNNLLKKSPSQASQKVLLNPVFNTMMEINQYNITLMRVGVGIIIYQNLTQDADLYLIARSLDDTEQTCKVMLQLRVCTDLDNIYPAIQKIEEVYLTTANTTFTIPIGNCYYGLNLSYSATSKSAVTYSFETHEPLKIYSAYANYQIIELIPIDGVNFMKISKQSNTYYIEICSESNLACLPQSHKSIGGIVSRFRLFTNSQLQFLMTYTLSNEPGSIYIESLYGNEFPVFKITDPGEDLYIDDYTLSNQNIFVVRARTNRLEVYKLDFIDYPKVSTIDDQITKPQLFRPRQIHLNTKHSRNLYIKCVDKVLIVEYSTQVRLISTIYAKIRSQDDWDKWKFQVSSKSLVIIYSFNGMAEQYSVLEPESPTFLKILPTARMQFSDPIVSYMSSLGNLVILTISKFGNQLSIFKTGQPSIESLYTSIPIMSEYIVNIKGLDLEQLLLMYQDADYHIYAERVHSSVTMVLGTNFPMKEFITTEDINISVQTFKETVTVISLLKIINYQEKISTESTNAVPIQLPSTADNIRISFDPSKWFTGPVTNIQLLSNDQVGTSIIQTHQFDKFTQKEAIDKYYDIFNDGEYLWVLTQNQTIVILDYALNPVRKSISGIPNTCKKFTKSNQIIFLFCVRQSNMKCITPILLYQNDVFIIRPDILYTSSWTPQNIIKADIVHDRLAILDNDIYGEGQGILYVYKIVKSKVSRDISLVHQRLLTSETFNLSKNATINDYQVLHLEDDLYYVYLTISTFGFVSGQVRFQEDITTGWTKIDLLNDSPKYMDKYQIEGNQVLQLRIIDSYQTNSGPQKQFHHIVIITTLYGAHLELQMSYRFDNSTKSFEFKYSTFIEAFNTYYRQTRLNWLTAPAYNASRQNMFLTAYFNQSNFHITVVLYPLMTARPNQIASSFPIFKEGVMFECYEPALISSVLIVKDDLTLFGWTPVCNDIFQVQSHKLLLYKLSTNISLVFNYRQPPRKVNQLRFHAVNDYSYADYLLSVGFQRPNQMSWWEILLICSSVFVVIFIVFCIIRKLRILKEKREDELYSSLMESISNGDNETKKDTAESVRYSQSQFVEQQLGGQIRGSIFSFGNDESHIDT